MTTDAGPRAIVVRHVGAVAVVGACIAASLVAHRDFDHVSIVWLAALFYLVFCMEPVRRVLRSARLSWTAALCYLGTAVCCIGAVFCLPVTDLPGPHRGASSIVSLVAGNDDLAVHAQDIYTDVSWIFVGLMALGTLSLWYEIMRLARASEWRSIDHDAGDGSFATGATLATPLGTSITRPAQSRPARLPKKHTR